jgi:Mg-chelatase subunit ChlD
MRNKTIAFVVLILAIFVFISSSYTADPAAPESKSQPQAQTAAKAPQTEDRGFDIVLLIDSSGSMKKTDPRDYRKEAARLFISLLGSDDRVGVLSFGDSAQVLSPLTANNQENRAGLFAAVKKISSRELSTDITSALKKGVAELEQSKRKNRAIILMSDGKLDLLDPDKDRDSHVELNKMLPGIKKAGIRVYSVAFSELADSALLGSISEKTGGLFRYAKTDSDIHVMFASIFEKIKSPDSVALKGDTFEIDRDVREAVLLISKQAGTSTVLLDPAGRKISRKKTPDNFQWYGSDVFDMITIKEPATGAWRVSLSSRDGNRIFVLTDLKLKSSFSAASMNRGDNALIDAWLEREDKKIIEKAVLDLVTFSAEITGPDGKVSKTPLAARAAPDTGVYAAGFTADLKGDYAIRIIAEGKTFNRTRDIYFNSVEQPAAPAAQPGPKPEPGIFGDLDLETTLLISLAANALLLLIILLLLGRARRYKKLSSEAAADSQPVAPAPEPAPVEATMPVDPVAVKAPPVEEPSGPKPLDIASLLPAKGESDSDRIRRLIGIIEFQRGKVYELMMIRDTFDSFRKRLGELRARSIELGSNIIKISETHNLKDEMTGLAFASGDGIKEIETYIEKLEKEEDNLDGKLKKWENEIQKLMKDEIAPAAAQVESEPDNSAEMAALEVTIGDLNDMLKARDATIEDLKKQLEDLDREYMILYHAQQQQQDQNKM